MQQATLKINIANGNMEIVEAKKRYSGFPGAVDLVRSILTEMGVKYDNDFGWTCYTATVTLGQWVEIKTACADVVNRMKNTNIPDRKRCAVCGGSDVQFNTTGTDVCNDCA